MCYVETLLVMKLSHRVESLPSTDVFHGIYITRKDRFLNKHEIKLLSKLSHKNYTVALISSARIGYSFLQSLLDRAGVQRPWKSTPISTCDFAASRNARTLSTT